MERPLSEEEVWAEEKLVHLEAELYHLREDNHHLAKKLENQFDSQHEMENLVEEHQVNAKRREEQVKIANRKF